MLNLFAKRAASSKNDILSGITVALALVPEAIAFAFVAGVPPHVGLYSAIIVGLITSLFGGRPGMISGATGAMAVVVVGLVHLHGIGYLIPAVILVVTGLSWGFNHYSNEKLQVAGTGHSVLTVQDILVSNLKSREVDKARSERLDESLAALRAEADSLGADVVNNGAEAVLSPAELAAAAGRVKEVPSAGLPMFVFFNEAF